MEPSRRLHLTLGKIMHGKAVLHRLEDVSQVHRTEHQDLAPVKDEENEQFECIKEEQMEHFISVGKLHMEEQQQPLIKMEEDPPYVKEEGMDVPLWAVEPLSGQDGPSEASGGAEPLSGSSSTEESQADKLMAPPSASYDASSHLRIHQQEHGVCCRQVLITINWPRKQLWGKVSFCLVPT
ncbi:uncharacterized protein LOC144085639 isoform X4 [Stigmatopora argus]